jgi:pimeloyl-ACP methyl ester carboxylesterase
VALVLGLAVLGWAARSLWSAAGARRRHRLWFVPGTLLAVVLAWSVALAVGATVVPPTPRISAAPRVDGATVQEAALRTDDGVRLSAWWVPSRNGAAVVLLHGSGENRSATVPQADVLAGHGYGVLLLDARGHGRSGGRGMDFGWYGDSDIRAAGDFLFARPDVDPRRIGLLGLSLGGEEAVGAAAGDPRFRAVVAEGATGRTAADKAAWLPGGALGAVQRGIDRLTYGVVDVLTPAGPPRALRDSVAAATDTRFLLVVAGTMPDEARAARVFRAAAPARVAVWEVPDAGHTGGLRTEPAAWERTVTGFLDDALPAGV